jgi:hypothetical protein
MNSTTTIAAVLVVLLAAGGAAAGTGGVPTTPADVTEGDTSPDGPSNVDASATYDDGTVTVTVTDGNDPVENVAVEVDDRRATTGTNGTAAVETNASDEFEVELENGGFEGELEYLVRNGSLTLVEESYEYGVEEDVADDADDEDDEDDADDADDEDDEGEEDDD